MPDQSNSGTWTHIVFPRLARVFALLAAMQLLGGHWLALQSAAWVGMVISYSQEDSFVSALEKTFDGNHPCNLCLAVKKGHSEEQKQQSAKVLVKFEAVLPVMVVGVPEQDGMEFSYTSIEQHSSARYLTPPTPPPLA